jgi:hypothetical protein
MAFRNDIDNLDKFLKLIQTVQDSATFEEWYQTNKDQIEYEVKYHKTGMRDVDIKPHEIHNIFYELYKCQPINLYYWSNYNMIGVVDNGNNQALSELFSYHFIFQNSTDTDVSWNNYLHFPPSLLKKLTNVNNEDVIQKFELTDDDFTDPIFTNKNEMMAYYQRCYRYEQLLEELDLLNTLGISSRSNPDVEKPQYIQLNIGKSIYDDQHTMEQVKIYSERLAEKLNLTIK